MAEQLDLAGFDDIPEAELRRVYEREVNSVKRYLTFEEAMSDPAVKHCLMISAWLAHGGRSAKLRHRS